jgi:hypothetical protein
MGESSPLPVGGQGFQLEGAQAFNWGGAQKDRSPGCQGGGLNVPK